MTPGNNIVQYGRDVDRVLGDFRDSELPGDVNITRMRKKIGIYASCIATRIGYGYYFKT